MITRASKYNDDITMNSLANKSPNALIVSHEKSYWPTATGEELARLERFNKKIGIIRLWPDQAAAEHESIERFRQACEILGVEIVELDRLGFFLEGERRPVRQEDVDFVISLHYETPKAYDCFSWGALWNPIDFYVEWGVSPYIDNQFSHDGFFMCGSPAVRRLAETELGDRFDASPMVDVNHTLAGPIYPPRLRSDRRVAYCGINWELLSQKKGRFNDLLKSLDGRDVLDIYGPTEVRGAKVWEGFKGYRRSAPFDGVSLIGDLAESGAVLALSSPAHVRSSIMSNRLFEAAAAGALVFVDENRFFENHFQNEVIRLDMSAPVEDQANQIERHLKYYNENPEAALALCTALQDKFLTDYSLHHQLLEVYSAFGKWRDKQVAAAPAKLGRLEFIVLLLDEDMRFPSDLLKDLAEQDYADVAVTIVKPGDAKSDERFINSLPSANIRVVRPDFGKEGALNGAGFMLAEAMEDSKADFFCLLIGNERVFKGFAREMVAAAAGSESGAVCGVLLRHYDPAEFAMTGIEYIDFLRPTGRGSNLFVTPGHMVLPAKTLRSLSGAFQMMSWSDLQKLLQASTGEGRAIVDKPLISGDLKRLERMKWLGRQSYEDAGAVGINARYMAAAAKTDVNVHVYRHTEAVSAMAIASLPENERRLIIIELLKTLPLPTWLIRASGWVLRRLVGVRRSQP